MDEEYRRQVEFETENYLRRLAALPLRESDPPQSVGQKEKHKGIFRRWFQNSQMTLIVWYTGSKEITGFQLFYGPRGADSVISWYGDQEHSHRTVDYGRTSFETALLGRDAGKINFEVFEGLYQYSGNLDDEILDCIRLRESILKNKGK